MTRFINRPEDQEPQGARVCIPQQKSAPMFQGWGPKF